MNIDPGEPQAPSFELQQSDRDRAAELLATAGIEAGETFIALHAGSAQTVLSRAKRWPLRNYARLIEMLSGDYRFVFLEGPDETGAVDEIMRHAPGSAVKKLKLTGPLGDAAAVLHRAGLYVGSDSGLAHLAAAVGTRAVTLFAPADPDRVCPFGNRDLVVQSTNPCSPCFMYPWVTSYPKMRCRAPFCIDGIEVERVMDKVRHAFALIPSPAGRG